MNNKGAVGLSEAFIFIAIVCLCILITMIMYNKTVKDLFGGTSMNGLTYTDTENKITKAAKKYTNNHNMEPQREVENITIKTLQNENLLGKINDPKDNTTICTGYVSYYKRGNDTFYDTFIKCGPNYHTKGYNANYDA